jgi:hypothetical protein
VSTLETASGGDVEDDPRDTPALGRDRAGHEALLGDDDVGAELVHHGVDLGDPVRDRGDEDPQDVLLERGQAGLLPLVPRLDVDIGEVEGRAHHEGPGADLLDQMGVPRAGVPGDLVTVGDQPRGDRQPGAQVPVERHRGEQDAGHGVLLGFRPPGGATRGPCAGCLDGHRTRRDPDPARARRRLDGD